MLRVVDDPIHIFRFITRHHHSSSSVEFSWKLCNWQPACQLQIWWVLTYFETVFISKIVEEMLCTVDVLQVKTCFINYSQCLNHCFACRVQHWLGRLILWSPLRLAFWHACQKVPFRHQTSRILFHCWFLMRCEVDWFGTWFWSYFLHRIPSLRIRRLYCKARHHFL